MNNSVPTAFVIAGSGSRRRDGHLSRTARLSLAPLLVVAFLLVMFGTSAGAQETAPSPANAAEIADKAGGKWRLGNQGRVHQLLAAHCLAKIENLYGSVFENILGEKITTKPVTTINSIIGHRHNLCLHCASK